MQKSTKSRQSGKVKKPRPDFPLFPHASGRWAKKVRGSLCYFGKVADDPKGQSALALWLDRKDDLLAGRKPRAKIGGVTLADLVNEYLADADARRAAGELSPLSFRDYQWTGARMVEHFGRTVDPTQIKPTEFAAFRTAMAAKYAPSRLGKTITVCRMMFRWAHESEVIETLPRFGPGFKTATKRAARLAKAASGGKAFEADELRRLLADAPDSLSAMILLGLNAGFGNMDIASLPMSALDLNGGWVTFPRPKTGIQRRVPLWPETLMALRTVIETRPKPASHDLADRVFLTTRCGAWIVIHDDGRRYDGITVRFCKLTKDAGVYLRGRSFYGLRHTLETVGGGARDQVALDSIMGHADASMADNYRHGIEDDRLRAVTNHVRAWLLIRVAKSGSHWTIMGHPNSYWTGDAWSTDIKAAVKFASEEEARSQITEQRAALLASPFCRE